MDSEILKIVDSKYKLPLFNRLFQSTIAGIYISLGCIAMTLVKSDTSLSPAISGILSGILFTIGLASIVTLGGQLFTGNCLMGIGVLEGKYSFQRMLVLLILDFLGNSLGCIFMASIVTVSGFHVDTLTSIATAKLSASHLEICGKALLCNLLVCLGVYSSWKASSFTDKLLSVLLPVTIFVACGFEHSIADVFFMEFAQGFTCETILYFMNIVTVSNLLSGLLFSTSIYLGFSRKG